MTRFPRGWIAGVVVVAGTGCATLPFLVSGSWARARIEALPAAAGEAGLPLRLDLLSYERGLYRARFSMAVHVPGLGHGAPARLEGRVRHRLLGAGVTAALVGDGWAAGLLGARASSDPQTPDLQADVRVTPWARSAWRGAATLRMPALSWASSPPGLDLTLSAAHLSGVADAGATEAALVFDALSIATRAGTVGLPPVAFAISAVRVQGRVRATPGGLAADLDLVADRVESRGVPYVRLTGVRGSADGVLSREGTYPLHLRQSLRAESNYGEVRTRLALHGQAAGEGVDAELEIEAPAGLAHLLLAPYPEVAARWRRERLLQEHGPRASLRLRWSSRLGRPGEGREGP